MGLISDITSRLGRQAQPAEKTTTREPFASSSTVTFDINKQDYDRASVIRDCRKMFDEDIRVRQNIWRVSSDMVSGNFGVQVTKGPYKARVEQIANDTLIDLGLMTSAGRAGLDLISYITFAMRDGDLFLQLGLNQNGVMELVKMPLMSSDIDGYMSYARSSYPVMYRNSNIIDKFADPKMAYYLSASSLPMASLRHINSPEVQWFHDWQMLHVRWQHEKPRRYGQPLLSAGRVTYKMLREGETDIAIRRKTRAGQKRQHLIKGATKASIEEYKEWNQDSLNDVAAAAADFFTNENTEIKVLQGDETIGVIEDIQHHLETLGVGMIIPLSMTGYGKNISRDIIEYQNNEYRRILEVFGLFPVEAIVKPIVEMNWLLNGIYPDNYEWDIGWSSREPWRLTADGLFKMFGLVSPEYWTVMASKVLPDFQPEKELAFVKKAYSDVNQMSKDGAQKAGKKPESGSTDQSEQDEKGRSSVV